MQVPFQTYHHGVFHQVALFTSYTLVFSLRWPTPLAVEPATMLFFSFALLLSASPAIVSSALTDSSLETHVDTLALDYSFKPVKEAYWTSIKHHRRTPFAVSPDGASAYLAYLDAELIDVHVQQVDPTTFAAMGTTVTVTGGMEAGGLVAHNDGFALLTNEALPSGATDAPADSTPVPVLYRFTDGEQTWKTFLGGPGVHEDFGLAASPDLNGDLVYSEEAELYGAYFIVTAYTGDASGHYGDSIQYVGTDGTLQTIDGASSSWGCSHNTGIAFEAADAAPFASICAEDQGEIWLNTDTQYMSGVKISNENTTNGGSGEPMGGMSGSYSGLARLTDSAAYVFAWVSRGATDLTLNEWLGDGYTNALNRTNNRNIAIAQFTDKSTLNGDEASSVVGATDGDSQVNWITQGTADCSNAHVAAFNSESVLVTWEEIADPICEVIAMGCRGTFTGAYYQLVTNGVMVGDAISATDVYVAGDMVTMSDGRICWPYVSMEWTLDEPVGYEGPTETTSSMSFACMNLDDTSSNSTVEATSSAALASSTTTAATSVVAGSSLSQAGSSTTQVALSPTESVGAVQTTSMPMTFATSVISSTSATWSSDVSVNPVTEETRTSTSTASAASTATNAAIPQHHSKPKNGCNKKSPLSAGKRATRRSRRA
ncbi:hypothetical protein GGR57DRAFT_481445 [Xylariaceae sp. FL1272]|nr:hypothetical protein GGR57DRAFT_481445 [Xylariaceae sp. FL1272]